MKAVILAAGIGSRLRPLTDSKPKCLVKVVGKPVLDYQIDAYRAASIDEIIIITGYRGDLIREHVRHIKNPGITLIENEGFESTNNMFSLALAEELVAGHPFLLSNADVAISADIVVRLVNHPAPSCVSVQIGAWNDESMKVSAQGRKLIDISKSIGPLLALGCSTDFYKFSADASQALFDRIGAFLARGESNAWTEVALQELMKRDAVVFEASPTEGSPWAEIDDYDDLMLAEMAFSGFDYSLSDIEIAFVDLDGTLFLGERKIAGAAEAIGRMNANGIRVYFLSNNSSRDKAEYVEKLTAFGVPCREDQIILSSDGAIDVLISLSPASVFVLGTRALARQVMDAGLHVTTNSDAEFVLAGYDTELTYEKLATASIALNAGADLVATHADIFCPTDKGPVPDIGALLEMLKLTTGKTPIAITGKPSPKMVEHLIGDTPHSRILVVGDRPYTDLELARRLSSDAVLVLSGETTRDDVEKLAGYYPSAVVPSIAYLG